MRAFYEFLVFDDVVKGNPVSKRLNVKEPERSACDRTRQAFLSTKEEDTVFDWLRANTPKHIAFAFETMRATGIRVSEAAALTGADVLRLDGKAFLRIRKGKGEKERYTPVLSACLCPGRQADIAKRLLTLAQERPGNLLFRVVAATLKGYAHRCKKATGIDFRSHRLRHTVGTTLLAEGVSLDVIQQVLGHANISTTRLYAAAMVYHRAAPEKLMALAADVD